MYLIRGATPIVPIVTAKQWRHQVVAMLDLRPGGSEGSPAMCVHGMPHGLVGAIVLHRWIRMYILCTQRRRNMFWSGGGGHMSKRALDI